jgi:hypothetical protein
MIPVCETGGASAWSTAPTSTTTERSRWRRLRPSCSTGPVSSGDADVWWDTARAGRSVGSFDTPWYGNPPD